MLPVSTTTSHLIVFPLSSKKMLQSIGRLHTTLEPVLLVLINLTPPSILDALSQSLEQVKNNFNDINSKWVSIIVYIYLRNYFGLMVN